MTEKEKDGGKGNPERFVYSEGELSYIDDDGKLVRVGEIPEHVRQEIARRERDKERS